MFFNPHYLSLKTVSNTNRLVIKHVSDNGVHIHGIKTSSAWLDSHTDQHPEHMEFDCSIVANRKFVTTGQHCTVPQNYSTSNLVLIGYLLYTVFVFSILRFY